MNPIKLIVMAFTFWSLNKGQSFAAKAVLKEAMDVVRSLGEALKDRRITPAEKVAIVKEIAEFSKTAIKSLDELVIPE
jgi:hypothetical protein